MRTEGRLWRNHRPEIKLWAADTPKNLKIYAESMTMEDLNNKNPKKLAVCSECDREVDHYYTFLGPTNEKRRVCWQCQMRDEKGFNAKRDFRRQSRWGYIPR